MLIIMKIFMFAMILAILALVLTFISWRCERYSEKNMDDSYEW